MRTACKRLILALLPLLPAPALGQNALRELKGEVFSIENGDQNPQFFPNVAVTIREFGASGLTNDQGLFRLRIPASLLPGQEVTLRHDKKGYAICSPLLGKQLIPADPAKVVEIRMLPEGSKLFWTDERIEEFIARTASESAKQLKGPQAGENDLSAYILELAENYGFTAAEVRREIGKWMEVARKDVTDFRKQGLVAFAEKNFRLAGENFRRSAEEKERQAAEQVRESAVDRGLSGDSYYNALDFREALKEYQLALKSLNAYHDGLGALGIKVYPEFTADVQQISLKLANARSELGQRVAGPDVRRHLEEAVQEYEKLIAKNPRTSNSQVWAEIQNNLGTALSALSERLDGAEGTGRLREAMEAYRQALTVCTRDDLPQNWAMTQNNLGATLRSLSERLGGAEGARRLNEATEAYRQALTVYTRDDLPQQWAMTQNNLGATLRSLSERLGGAEGARRLDEAAEAFRQALTVFTRDDHSSYWSVTLKNLGVTLQTQIIVGGFAGCLEQVDLLLPEEGIRNDPVAVASLQTLAIVCQVGMNQHTEASRSFESLVGLVERQPDDFHLVWSWDRTRDYLTQTEDGVVKASHLSLLRLLGAVSHDNREAILAGLKKVHGSFTQRTAGPKEAPRE